MSSEAPAAESAPAVEATTPTPAPETVAEPAPEIEIEATPLRAEPPALAPTEIPASAPAQAGEPAPLAGQAEPDVPESEPEPKPAPAPSAPPSPPQPAPLPAQAGDTSIKSRLGQAFEAIRFRKRAKLDKILALAAKKDRIKNDDVEKLLRVSDSTAQRYLGQLVKEGRLRRVGSPKQPTYELA